MAVVAVVATAATEEEDKVHTSKSQTLRKRRRTWIKCITQKATPTLRKDLKGKPKYSSRNLMIIPILENC